MFKKILRYNIYIIYTQIYYQCCVGLSSITFQINYTPFTHSRWGGGGGGWFTLTIQLNSLIIGICAVCDAHSNKTCTYIYIYSKPYYSTNYNPFSTLCVLIQLVYYVCTFLFMLTATLYWWKKIQRMLNAWTPDLKKCFNMNAWYIFILCPVPPHCLVFSLCEFWHLHIW